MRCASRWAALIGAALLTTTLLAATALPLAGCGASGTGSADPAAVTPESALAYVSVTVKPSGGAHGDAVSDLRRLTRLEDPFGRLAQALLSVDGLRLQYKREVEPWIGARAGVFFTALPARGATPGLDGLLGGQRLLGKEGLLSGQGLLGEEGLLDAKGLGAGAQGAAVADVSDESRAQAFLQARARAQHAHSASYRGVSFEAAPDGSAEGMVRGFVVIGSEAALKKVVDTSLGAARLSDASGYLSPTSSSIADVYLAPQSASFLVAAQASSLTIDGQLREANGSQPLLGATGAERLSSLPGDSWLAASIGDLRSAAPRLVALLRSAATSPGVSHTLDSLGAGSIKRLLAVLASPGARLEQLLAPWAGSAGVFVSGSSLLELQAALAIQSDDPAASHAAVGRLAALMRRAGATVASAPLPGTDAAVSVRLAGVPVVLYIANGQASDGHTQLVIGVGQASVQGALRPARTLASSPSYASASTLLGDGVKPSVIVEFPALLGMLEATGLTQSGSLEKVVPYLKPLGTLTAGSASGKGVTRVRARLSLTGG